MVCIIENLGLGSRSSPNLLRKFWHCSFKFMQDKEANVLGSRRHSDSFKRKEQRLMFLRRLNQWLDRTEVQFLNVIEKEAVETSYSLYSVLVVLVYTFHFPPSVRSSRNSATWI